MYKKYVKRLLDFILSATGIIVLFPVLLIVALLVKITSSGPVFFKQYRLGKNGNEFEIIKFRTMINKERLVDKEILKENCQVTKIGYYLRRLKIDELPQILNVIKGDMSLVGPRPSMPELMNDFNEDAEYRITVTPGLTGLAQINGNIYLSWEKRWKFDRKYVENISFILDFKIILRTILIVLFGEKKFKNEL